MNRPVFETTILILSLTFFAAVRTAALSSDPVAELSQWLRTDSRTERYLPVESSIIEIAHDAQTLGLPLGPIVDKVKEGANKGVDPAKLVAAVGTLVETMKNARETVEKHVKPAPEKLIRETTLFIEGGLDPAIVIAPLIGLSIDEKNDTEPFRAACAVLLEVHALRIDDQKILGSLGKSIVASRLPVSAYESVFTLFIKARAGRMGDADIITMITKILDDGGGIIQIEQELRRRLRNR
jgi:hypothetical protein